MVPRALLGERRLQLVWRLGLFRRRGLLLEDGRPLVVRFPGHWAGEGGPDFRGARLAVAGEELAGDVELHLTPSGWRRHRHGGDPAYASVVLHVALRRDPWSGRAEAYGSGAIPELVLEPYLELSEADLAAWTAPAGPAARPPSGRLLERLEELGLERFERRRRELLRVAGACGMEEAVYRAATTALGWKRNKVPFAELARLVPWREARALGEEALRRRYAEAGAGLPWRSRPGRPANHPRRRLEGWAALVPESPDLAALGAADLVARSRGLVGAERAEAIELEILLPARGDREEFRRRPAPASNSAAREAAAGLGVDPRALDTAARFAGALEWGRRNPAGPPGFPDRLAEGGGGW